jgi:hypothetical protein
VPGFTKTQLAIPALIVLVVVGAGGAQLWGQHAARVRLDETLASLPPGSSGHYGHLSYNVFTRTARIANLQLTRGGQRSLSVREIVLHHLGGQGLAADPYRVGALQLTDVEVWRGGHSLTAALIQAQNVAVLPPGVPPPPGTPSWLVAPDAATVLAAGSASADGIADDQGATLGAISISGYDDGHLQQISAARFADRQGNRIAAAAGSGIDLDGLDRVFDTGRYTPGAASWTAPRALIAHAEIDGVSSRGAAGSETPGSGGFDRLIVDGFAARPFDAAPTAATVNTTAFASDAAAAMAIGSLSLAGLQFTDNESKTSGKLGTLSFTGYADGALARFGLAGLSITGPAPLQLTIGQFGLTGLNVTKLLHAPRDESYSSLMTTASNGGFRLAGLTLSQAAVTTSAGAPVTLTSLAETVSGSTPVQSTVTLRGLGIPADANPQLGQALGLLGVDRLVFDLDEALSLDESTGDTTLKQAVLTARGLGTLSLSGQFTNLPRTVPADGGMAALNQIGLGPFRVTFTNDTLLQRAVAAQAKQTGKTPAEVMDQWKLAASFLAAAVVPGQPDAGEQVAAFMADPKSLTITAAPATPVLLGALTGATLGDAQKALNLHISANPAPTSP